MADFYAGTMQINDRDRKNGFSETYYLSANSYDDASTQLNDLWVARRDILSAAYKCQNLRVSKVGVKGDAKNSVPALVLGAVVVADHPAVDPWSALLYETNASPLHRGRKFLHGAQEDQFDGDQDYDPLADPQAVKVTAFGTAVKTTFLKCKVGGVTQYLPIVDTIPRRKTSHQIGRPFGQRPGRRRTA